MKEAHSLMEPRIAPLPKPEAARETGDWETLSAYAHLSEAVESLTVLKK